MKAGDIYWVEIPSRGGHEQSGRRPCIVLQNESVTEKLSTVIIVPLTTQQAALRFPGTVLLEPNVENGLRHLSVALVFQISAIDRRQLLSRSGKVSEARLAELNDSLYQITQGDRILVDD